MELYHASDRAIPAPDTGHSRKNVDFGPGFYTTPIYAQARKWCERFKRRGSSAVISRSFSVLRTMGSRAMPLASCLV